MNRIELTGEILDGEDFTGLRLKQFTATQSSLRRCRFDASRIDQACFGGGAKPSEYTDCSFDGARIRAIAPGIARFVRCSFRDCLIQDFFGVTVEFIDCVFSGRIEKAVFHGSVPEEDRAQVGRTTNEFSGNDFREAELVDVAFRGGIDLTKQRLPEGAGYLYLADAADALDHVRQQVVGWRDLELRRKALAILTGLEFDVQGGQVQLFISLNSVSRNQREASELLFQELRQAARAGSGDE
jgi:hypothetical protein